MSSGARPGWFDRFASATARAVSGAWFFAACTLLVLVWAPTYFVFGSVDTWQLVINTATTIVTFLLVALLQNSHQRGEEAAQKKLDAIAAALAELMLEQTEPVESSRQAADRMVTARRNLLAAVRIEEDV